MVTVNIQLKLQLISIQLQLLAMIVAAQELQLTKNHVNIYLLFTCW